jgi:chaperonin cofactor prefoldin
MSEASSTVGREDAASVQSGGTTQSSLMRAAYSVAVDNSKQDALKHLTQEFGTLRNEVAALRAEKSAKERRLAKVTELVQRLMQEIHLESLALTSSNAVMVRETKKTKKRLKKADKDALVAGFFNGDIVKVDAFNQYLNENHPRVETEKLAFYQLDKA